MIQLRKWQSSSMFHGFCLTMLGSGTSKLILMLSTFIFTHILSKHDFGTFSFLRNTLNMIFCFSALNYVGLVTKFTAESEFEEKSKYRLVLLFLFSILVCLLIGIVLIASPKIILDTVIDNGNLSVYLKVVGLLLPLFMMQPLLEGFFRGQKKFRLIGFLQILSSLFFVVLVTLGAFLYGLDGAIAGLMIYYSMYSILTLFICVREKMFSLIFHKISWEHLKPEMKILLTMVIPVFILSFIEAPINWWAQVLMTKYGNISDVGGMSAILQIRNALIIIPNYYFSTFTTFQASLNAQGMQMEYFKNVRKSVFACLILGVIAAFGMSMFGQQVLALYGKAYSEDVSPYYIAMFSFPLMLTISLFRTNLLIKEHQQLMLFSSVLSSIVQIVLMYYLLNLNVNTISSYFLAQLGYYCISFIIFAVCTYYDSRKARCQI